MIKHVFLSSLRTKEIGVLAFSLLSTVQEHDPELIGVKVYFDDLNDSVPELRLFTTTNSRSDYSDLIEEDRVRVKQLCLAIISQVKTVKRGNLAAQRDAVFSLHPIVTKNLIIAKKTKWYDYTNDIEKFLIEVQSTELFKNASKTIGIDLFIAELSAIKLRHDENCSTRTHLKNERLSLEKQKLRKVILKKISNLLAAIELAPVSNKTFDFKPLTIALNSVITNSNAVIRSRKTRNINKVIKKESVAPTIKSNATETLPVGA